MFVNPSFEKHLGERAVYPDVGYCIYCGRSSVPLTDEHTIPDGLGGRHILPKASCTACQKTINTFEQYCMRTFLGNVRASLGIKAAKRRPRPPASVRVRRKDGTIERVSKPIEELPVFVAFPVFPAPFALLGLPAPEIFDGLQWVRVPADIDRALVDFDASEFLSEVIKPQLFARMLAKIAHSHCIAVLGADRFRSVLPPLILNEGMRYIQWVGGSLKIEPPEPDISFRIDFEIVPRFTDGALLGVCGIRLFPNLGGPTYRIVIGEMLKPWP